MPLQILSGDITQFKADAAAVSVGWEYIPWLPAGQAEIAEDAPRSQAKFTFRVSVPTWRGGRSGEVDDLRRCYRSLLQLTKQRRCRSLALPVLGTSPGRFAKETALNVAAEEIYAFLENDAMQQRTIYLFTHQLAGPALLADASPRKPGTKRSAMPATQSDRNVDDFMRRIRTEKENFHDMLFRHIWNGEVSPKKRKEREVAVYRSIFMSRQQFGKLREPDYSPSKETILWLAVALHLTAEETHELLNTVGYTFCRWRDFDLIVLYFITNGVYDIMLINEMLLNYGQKTFQLC